MDYYGIGFSNIRLPNDKNSYIYKYNYRINTFPEEVFVHEFLHSLERNLNERNYTIPALHDYEKYGYKNKNLQGLKKWYKDYMQKEIEDIKTGEKVGLDKEVYKMQPVKNENFDYSYKLDYLDEPENFMEEVSILAKKILELF